MHPFSSVLCVCGSGCFAPSRPWLLHDTNDPSSFLILHSPPRCYWSIGCFQSRRMGHSHCRLCFREVSGVAGGTPWRTRAGSWLPPSLALLLPLPPHAPTRTRTPTLVVDVLLPRGHPCTTPAPISPSAAPTLSIAASSHLHFRPALVPAPASDSCRACSSFFLVDSEERGLRFARVWGLGLGAGCSVLLDWVRRD